MQNQDIQTCEMWYVNAKQTSDTTRPDRARVDNVMSLIESNVRRGSRRTDTHRCSSPSRKPTQVSMVTAAGKDGDFALSAAELACIESKRAKDRLALSNEKVSVR